MSVKATRDEIVVAADQLFYRQGYEHTSFSDIASAVQISRGNFYHRFKSKDEILDAVIGARLGNTQKMLEQWEARALINCCCTARNTQVPLRHSVALSSPRGSPGSVPPHRRSRPLRSAGGRTRRSGSELVRALAGAGVVSSGAVAPGLSAHRPSRSRVASGLHPRPANDGTCARAGRRSSQN